MLGTDHKNAADMRMCIDVLEVLYTRAEISTFVLVAGDRDYIPVIQHLRRQARRVLGVGFRESVSGDLLLNLGDQQFLDARELLPSETLERLEARRSEQQALKDERERRFNEQAREIAERARAAQSASQNAATASNGNGNGKDNGASGAQGAGYGAPDKIAPVAPRAVAPAEVAPTIYRFGETSRIHDEDALRCLEIILARMQQLQQLHGASELWLGPFLRQLADEMSNLAEYERRSALDILARSGATHVEKRQGDPHPYSVLLVNYQHPDVWELNP